MPAPSAEPSPPPALPAADVVAPLAPADPALNPPPVEPPPVEEPKKDLGPLKIGVWGRVDATLNGEDDELNDPASTGLFQLSTSGKLHDYFSFTANFIASYGGGTIAGDAALLDAIIQFEPHDLFHIWAGRNLVPVDRSNFSGPWFMGPWFYPLFGFADGQIGPTVPKQGPYGRNDGLTAWGFYAADTFSIKYYVGAYDLHVPNESPLISGRLNLTLLGAEPGYYSNSTYYGKDLLALGAGFQYKKDGSSYAWNWNPVAMGSPAPVGDYSEFNVDLLFEKKLGADAVLNLEGAYYMFNGDYERTDAAWFGVASVLLGGAWQPLVRIQQALPAYEDEDETSTIFDGQIGYVLNGFATRFAAGFRHATAGDLKDNTLFLGAQFMK